MRDCKGCKNREGTLLARTLAEERILLATGWFNCVRFEHGVIEPEHPFHVLFDHERHPHIAMASWDTKTFVLVPRASPKVLWRTMKQVLRKELLQEELRLGGLGFKEVEGRARSVRGEDSSPERASPGPRTLTCSLLENAELS